MRGTVVACFVLAACGRIGFDARGDGGADDGGPGGDSLSIGPRTWVNQGDGTPGAIVAPRLAFDTYRNHVVMYGGDRGAFPRPNNPSAAMWELTDSGWTLICDPCAPGPRFLPAFQYDSNGKALLYGGGDTGGKRSDTWEFDSRTSMWTQRTIGGTPPGPREGASMIYLADVLQYWLVGGWNGTAASTNMFFTNGLTWNVASQTPIATGAGTGLAMDAVLGYLWVLEDGGDPLDTDADVLLEYATPTWNQICTACSGTPRRDASLVYDPANHQLLMLNGFSATSDAELSGTWALVGSSFEKVSNDPPARDSVGAVYDPVRDRIVVYGGNGTSCSGPNGNCDETWEYIPQ